MQKTKNDKEITDFYAQYSPQVSAHALLLREVVLANLPGIIEQLDIPARMVGYCYGQKYSELICVIIPSKKGLKLGFNRGTELPDPEKLLKGTGKISRYVEIKSDTQINSIAIKQLLLSGLKAYKEYIPIKKR